MIREYIGYVTETTLDWTFGFPYCSQGVRTMHNGSFPTIIDVAKLAGVSTATVSRVVNGSTKVSPKTAEVVALAVRACQYEPNRDAIRLRSLRSDSRRSAPENE